ncbi:MAG: chorismate--pyruvate lyase [Paraglaciecola sp.]|jgi:chorismate--pyruvate lyase
MLHCLILTTQCNSLNQNTIFPFGINARWNCPAHVNIPDAYLKNWLLDTGSLTERLQSHCREFQVVVLGQRQAALTLEEKLQLEISKADYDEADWQVREVILLGEKRPWVFARSIIPQSLCQSDFANLGNKPLGQLIFNDKRFSRSPFQVTHMAQPEPLLAQLGFASAEQLWGRRSVFCFQEIKMMVAEVFLPGAPAYKNIAHLIGAAGTDHGE